jgi:type I restriction enzyme S subunit
MLTLKHDTMLGDIPGDWGRKPLRSLLSVHYPGDWGDDRGPQMVKVLRSTNLTSNGRLDLADIALRALPKQKVERFAPEEHDILLERSGGGPGQPVGRVGLVAANMPGHGFSNFLHLLRPNVREINARFLGWILYQVNRSGRILRLEQQTTQMRNLNFRDYLTMPLPVPPPDEQAAIARVLDAVDTALERTRVAVDLAHQVRVSLIGDLLVRGIGKSGMVRHAIDGSSEFTKTPLGQLPAAWRLGTIFQEFDLQNGFTLNADRRPRLRKRRYLRVANVKRDALDLRDIQELEAGDAEFFPRILVPDDLLVVEGHADRMQIGRCARVTETAAGMTFQNHLFRLRTKGAVEPAFGCLWLNSTYAQRFWNARCATSSGLNTINQRTLKRLVIPVPPTIEQRCIVRVIEQQRRHLEGLLEKRSKLETLKKSLMRDLLTGRVRVTGLMEAAAA